MIIMEFISDETTRGILIKVLKTIYGFFKILTEILNSNLKFFL